MMAAGVTGEERFGGMCQVGACYERFSCPQRARTVLKTLLSSVCAGCQ